MAGKSEITILLRPLAPGRYRFFGDFNEATAEGAIIGDSASPAFSDEGERRTRASREDRGETRGQGLAKCAATNVCPVFSARHFAVMAAMLDIFC